MNFSFKCWTNNWTTCINLLVKIHNLSPWQKHLENWRKLVCEWAGCWTRWRSLQSSRSRWWRTSALSTSPCSTCARRVQLRADGWSPPWTCCYEKNRGRFHKAKMPKFVLQNTKILKAFSMFNFIKALTPKFSQHNAKKDGIFKVQFHNTNLALKMPKWVNT